MIFKNGVFYSIGIPEGRAIFEGGNWKYEFFYQDHLGNTRVTFSADGDRLVKKDATDFEPMGTRLSGTGFSGSPENRFKFQDKESLTLFGLENMVVLQMCCYCFKGCKTTDFNIKMEEKAGSLMITCFLFSVFYQTKNGCMSCRYFKCVDSDI